MCTEYIIYNILNIGLLYNKLSNKFSLKKDIIKYYLFK